MFQKSLQNGGGFVYRVLHMFPTTIFPLILTIIRYFLCHFWLAVHILARFRWLFCHTVHCCNMIGSGFIWENIKKITSKNLQMIISQRTKVKLKIRHLNDIFFSFKFGIIGFWGMDNLQKKFGDFILKFVDFSMLSNFC